MMASAGSAAPLAILAGRVGGHKEQRAQSQRHERAPRVRVWAGEGRGRVVHSLLNSTHFALIWQVGPEGKELGQTSRATIHYRKLNQA